MGIIIKGFKAGGIIQSRLWNAAIHTFSVESKTMRVDQRDLLRITSTFQAMKLLESYYNGQKGEHKK